METKFRLDRSAFRATTVKEADDHVTEWKNRTPFERLEAAWYLINQSYGINAKTRVDRTVFSKVTRQ